MENKKVLVVDDEPAIRELLGEILSEFYPVFFAKNADEAIHQAKNQGPSLIILDILMPGKSGVQICKELRSDPKTSLIPVLMLTALNDAEQRTEAFLAGADDYMAKPFLPSELLARVESKMNRFQKELNLKKTIVQFGDLRLNFEEFKAEIAGQPIELGQIEFKILNCLIKNNGRLVERQSLHDSIWGDEAPAERALDPHITMLRRKLKNSSGELKTIYGRGYCLALKEKMP